MSAMFSKVRDRFTVHNQNGLIATFASFAEAVEFILRNGTHENHPNAILTDRMARRGGKQRWDENLKLIGLRPIDERTSRERRAR